MTGFLALVAGNCREGVLMLFFLRLRMKLVKGFFRKAVTP